MDADVLKLIFALAGGLGIFLLGMRNMSDGLQAIAGPSLRRLIGMVTDNRFLAVGVGTLVTCLVQSSSITTVMTVGFVNSGIMALNQAMGVVLGANIGTTITGWILVLKIGKWGLPLLGFASFFVLFSKRERVRYIAMTVMGIGMVFFGLELMKNGFKPIRTMPAFEAWFHEFQADSYLGVLKCAFVGCVLTVIVQSSSATLGITIALALTGVLKFETAAALVLGENIGTTITAYLASLGATTNARRAAYFHILFNVLGVLWITALFSFYLPLIRWIALTFSDIPDLGAMELDAEGKESYPYTTAGIAMVHTVFNVVNVLVFLPFVGFFANFLENRVKDRVRPEKLFLTHLDFQMYDSPFAAMEQSSAELKRMRTSTREMLDDLAEALNDTDDRPKSELIFKREDTLDVVQKEITVFLTDVLSGQISSELAEEAKQQIRISDEYESVSDYIMQVLKLRLRLKDVDLNYSPEQTEDLEGLHARVLKFFDLVTNDSADPVQLLEQAKTEGESINEYVRSLRSRHWDRLSTEKAAPLISTTFSDALHSYRKIKEHLLNVAEVKGGEK